MRNEKSGIGESAPAGTQRKHPAGVKPRQGRRTPPSPSVPPPLAGEAFLRRFPKGAPARGAVGASRLRGASPPGGRDTLQNPAGPCMRRGRCSHRPAACPRRRQRGLMQASLPARAAQTSRRRKAPARCHTPPSAPAAHPPPLAGEAFLRRFPKGAPARGAVGVSRLRGASPPGGPGGRDILQNPAGPCMRRGRCSHRPASFPAAAAFSGPMKIIGPCAGLAQPGKIPGKATRQCTPPSPSVPPPLAGEAFLKAAAQRVRRRPRVGPLFHTCGTNRTFS